MIQTSKARSNVSASGILFAPCWQTHPVPDPLGARIALTSVEVRPPRVPNDSWPRLSGTTHPITAKYFTL
jgi:hypothetical protein